MKKVVIYILVLLNSVLFSQKNFVGCNKGLDDSAWGLYNDTVLNKLIVFGWFQHADGIPIKGIATWDGEKFDSLGTGSSYCVGTKREVIIRYKNKLYAQFSDYYLHSYDYTTKTWTQIPGLINGQINDATIYNDELILAGDFSKVGNTTVRDIIKFDGTNYDTLPKPLFSFYLNAVVSYNNELYIGGNFDPAPFTAIAKYDGTKWVKVADLGGSPYIYGFQIYHNKLYVSGSWATLNGQSFPSLATWDGQAWGNIGDPRFSIGGPPASLNAMKVYKNKLYVFGGIECVVSLNKDTVKTSSMAVWNDTIWCGVKPQVNFGIIAMENYKDSWYFGGDVTMYGDTLPYTLSSKSDTVNYLGKYVGNNGKLERNCFDKVPETKQGVLYPNPTNSEIYFNMTDYFGESCNLKIVNCLGQIISDYQGMKSDSKLDLSIYSSGLYLFVFYHNHTQKTFKVIKE